MKKRPLYMDCAATTPVDPRVAEVVMHFMTEEYGNSSSRTHVWGTEAKKAVEEARSVIADAANADPDEVVFTSGATESTNLAILGLSQTGLVEGKIHVITTKVEHKATLEPLKELERRGFSVTYLAPDANGIVSPDEVANALTRDTLLVSVIHANNETGVLQPIEDIALVLKDHDAFFHVDAAQSFSKLIVPLQKKRINMISICAHKMCGPMGIGALILRKNQYRRPPISPLFRGGGQERTVRPGTLSVPLIGGFGMATQLALQEFGERRAKSIRIGSKILQLMQDKGYRAVGADKDRIENIMSFVRPGIDSEALILTLKDLVAISNGASCLTSKYQESYVLKSMNMSASEIASATRWSWCHLTEEPSTTLLSQIAERLTMLEH